MKPWSLVAALSVALASCGSEPPPAPEPLSAPTRTATQDREVRALVAAAGEARICELLEGRLVPLTPNDAPTGPAAGSAPAVGRLLVERCRAERREEGLDVHLQGRGWLHADERRGGPLGTSFAVEGYLRFGVTADMSGALDLGYHSETHVATIWFTPRRAPAARLTPMGTVPIRTEGGWSGIVGAIGELLGGPLERQASPEIARYGAAIMSRRLSSGLTATVDLCTGQIDTLIGALGDGQVPRRPWRDDGRRWLENQRVRLYSGGVDVAGPFGAASADLTIDVESEAGAPFVVRALCEPMGRRVVEAFVQQRPAPLLEPVVQRSVPSGRREVLRVEDATCPIVLVITPSADATAPTELRYRVREGEGRAEPIVRCPPRR